MRVVTYIGTHDDETEVITHAGVTFHKGKGVEVEAKLADASFAGNPTFTVADAKPHAKPKA